MRLPEIERLKNFFWTKKRKCSHTAQGTAFLPLTLPFHLMQEIEKSFRPKKENARICSKHRVGTADTSLSPLRDFEKKCLDRKTKMLAYCSEYRVGTINTSLLHVRQSEIEISKKILLDQKTKMLVHCSRNHISTVDTFLSPVRHSEIEISKNYYY